MRCGKSEIIAEFLIGFAWHRNGMQSDGRCMLETRFHLSTKRITSSPGRIQIDCRTLIYSRCQTEPQFAKRQRKKLTKKLSLNLAFHSQPFQFVWSMIFSIFFLFALIFVDFVPFVDRIQSNASELSRKKVTGNWRFCCDCFEFGRIGHFVVIFGIGFRRKEYR